MMINEKQKPYQTTQEEQTLRWDYAQGNFTLKQFNNEFNRLKKAGKIIRNGKVVT
jgi:hypothetical protein